MAKAKSVTQRFAQTVKSIASKAAKAAKATRKALEPDKRTATSRRQMIYPLAADGLVSDPMLLQPAPAARKRRATKTARRARKPARKAGKKASSRRSAVAKKTAARG